MSDLEKIVTRILLDNILKNLNAVTASRQPTAIKQPRHFLAQDRYFGHATVIGVCGEEAHQQGLQALFVCAPGMFNQNHVHKCRTMHQRPNAGFGNENGFVREKSVGDGVRQYLRAVFLITLQPRFEYAEGR